MFVHLLYCFSALDTHSERSSEQKHLFALVSETNIVHEECKLFWGPSGIWFIHLGLRRRWINHISPRCLKINYTYFQLISKVSDWSKNRPKPWVNPFTFWWNFSTLKIVSIEASSRFLCKAFAQEIIKIWQIKDQSKKRKKWQNEKKVMWDWVKSLKHGMWTFVLYL